MQILVVLVPTLFLFTLQAMYVMFRLLPVNTNRLEMFESPVHVLLGMILQAVELLSWSFIKDFGLG